MLRKGNLFTGFFDRNGAILPIDCVVYGALPNTHYPQYFALYRNNEANRYEMFSRSGEYIENVTQAIFKELQYVGMLVDNRHLV